MLRHIRLCPRMGAFGPEASYMTVDHPDQNREPLCDGEVDFDMARPLLERGGARPREDRCARAA